MKNILNVAVLGSTGYVGMELVKILSEHTNVNINFLGSDSIKGKHLSNIENIHLSTNGKYLVTASEKGTIIRIFNTDTKEFKLLFLTQ